VRISDLKSLYSGDDPEEDVLMKGDGLEKCQARGEMGSNPLPALQSSMIRWAILVS